MENNVKKRLHFLPFLLLFLFFFRLTTEFNRECSYFCLLTSKLLLYCSGTSWEKKCALNWISRGHIAFLFREERLGCVTNLCCPDSPDMWGFGGNIDTSIFKVTLSTVHNKQLTLLDVYLFVYWRRPKYRIVFRLFLFKKKSMK